MSNLKEKILSLFLVIAVVATILPMNVFAIEGFSDSETVAMPITEEFSALETTNEEPTEEQFSDLGIVGEDFIIEDASNPETNEESAEEVTALEVSEEASEEVSAASTDSKNISNIRWGTEDKKGTLYWDAYDGASYYIVSCANRKNIQVTKTSYDFSSYITEKGTYKASIVGYDSGGFPVTYLCYSPELIIDYNTYTIKCYLTTSDNAPITTSQVSINKSYKLIQYKYTDKDEAFQLEEPTLENYYFIGWSVDGNNSVQNPVTITADTGNQKYIARWQGKSINVSFDSQGGTEVSSKEYEYGKSIGKLPTTTRDYYELNGWYTEVEGGTCVSSSDKIPSCDITYYAHWTPINYTIELYSVEDGVTCNVGQIEYNVESEEILLPQIKREGYIFNGWTGEGIENPKKSVQIPTGSYGSKAYYANWRVDPCAYEHDYEDIVTPATVKEDGKIVPTCKNCGKRKDAKKISKINKVSLNTITYVYDGSEKKPTVKILDSNGKSLKVGTDYILTYKNNKNVGTATAMVTFKGKYAGTVGKNFTINPKGTTIKKLYPESKKITVQWNKQSAQTSGYQIEYTWPAYVATSKILTIKGSSNTSLLITKLANNRDYYVRIRTYKDVNGTKYYSTWSSQKKIYVDKIQMSCKSATLYRGQTKNLSLKYIPSGAKVIWKSSNKSIATVSSSGKVKAKGLGKTTISAKYKGITYKATINVTYMTPNYGSILLDYDTRNNCFIMKIKNNSSKTMTILPGTTIVEDADYTRFDRNIYLSQACTIYPGEMKTIRFKVQGSITWYDVTDFTLFYYFRFDGKDYYAKTNWFTVSKYKSGSKWKNSYTDTRWFEDFRMEAVD